MGYERGASLATLRHRAAMLGAIREFFAARGVLEVETPALSPAAVTDPAVESVVANARALQPQLHYLQTSPEFAMKRLLTAGMGDIYQVSRVFRDGERGRWHDVEFTLLEWYRLGMDHYALMDEVAELLRVLVGPRVDPVRRATFREVVKEYAGFDPIDAGVEDCRRCLARAGIPPPATGDRTASWGFCSCV